MTAPSIRLIEHLLSMKESELTPTLAQSASLALLDNVGCGLYGSRQPWGKIVADLVLSERSTGRATLYGAGEPVAPVRAALANGTATHGFELDDIILGALSHPGAVVAPAALAAAECVRATGTRLLLGLIAGYEAMARVGRALGAEHNNRGFHTTGIAGPVAAAVAAGVVMQLPMERLLSAIGIASSSASGIKAFTQGSGGMVKRMHAGRAAEAGLLACELARRGFTGPAQAVDGKFGLLEVIGGSGARAGFLDEDLGRSLAITQVWVKVYPCCGLIHSTAHALEALKQRHQISADQVREIRVCTSRRALDQNGDPEPREPMTAQYSIPYCAGVSIAKDPKDPDAYAERNLWDPAVRKIAALTKLEVDEEMDRQYPAHFGARVEMTLADGRAAHIKILDPHGTPADPCSPAEVEAKFRRLASAGKEPAAIERIIAETRSLASAASLAGFSQALRSGDLDAVETGVALPKERAGAA